MPQSVREWVELWFGPQPDTAPAALVSRLLSINEAVTEPWSEGDVEVLVVENQGVWLWGLSASVQYVERENEPGVPWRPIAEEEAAFWLHHAAFEAVCSLPANRSGQRLDDDTVSSIERASTALPCGEWSWPGNGHHIRFHGRSLAMICKDEDGHWVVAAAPTEDELAWIDDLVSEWDESDTRSP